MRMRNLFIQKYDKNIEVTKLIDSKKYVRKNRPTFVATHVLNSRSADGQTQYAFLYILVNVIRKSNLLNTGFIMFFWFLFFCSFLVSIEQLFLGLF